MTDSIESKQVKLPWSSEAISPLIEQLVAIRRDMVALETESDSVIRKIPDSRRRSARNLMHYIALRRRDIRELQEELVSHGLSSLGRCESYVMANIEAVIGILCNATSDCIEGVPGDRIPVDFEAGRELLQQSAKRLFGDYGDSALPIMVTMTSRAAEDYEWVRDLLAAGMTVMRINCAHDDRPGWTAMVNNLRRAEREVGRLCRIAMDLAGPKIRTGPIEPGPQVVSWKPVRDDFGRVIKPARIWISPTAEVQPPPNFDYAICVSEDWWKAASIGDILKFDDAAGRARELKVVSVEPNGLSVETSKTAYITPETVVRCCPAKREENVQSVSMEGRFGPIPPRESFILLRQGDKLLITDLSILGRSAYYDEHSQQMTISSIGCTLPEIFRDAKQGDRLLLDDGKVEGIIDVVSKNELAITIVRARERGQRLRADKGINVPDTDLQLPALTAKDVEDLEFIAKHADMVSYSFVRRPDDIRMLHDELARLGNPNLPIVLKIENRQAFENLPSLLLEAMRCSATTGVMIARGDLAVECGWERLVEVQEEILWVCEAAHTPVIWATQVLEGLAKKGLPTRAEVTDAGMGARAECVMLNNGPNILETVRTLHRILNRMQEHQVKKRSTFRRLKLANHLFSK